VALQSLAGRGAVSGGNARSSESGVEVAGCGTVASVSGGVPQPDDSAASRWVSVEPNSGVRSGIRNPQIVQKRAVGRISFPQFGHASINLLPCERRQLVPPQFSRTPDTRSWPVAPCNGAGVVSAPGSTVCSTKSRQLSNQDRRSARAGIQTLQQPCCRKRIVMDCVPALQWLQRSILTFGGSC
jgi:hypothetical protein